MSSSMTDLALLEFSQNMAYPTSPKYIDYSACFQMSPRRTLSRHRESDFSPRAAYQALSPSYKTTTFAEHQTHIKRRSVDSMKELMPLSLPSLTPATPSSPTFGPVYPSTTRQIAPVARRLPSKDRTSIPWLHAGLDSYAFDDLAPNKFRETPIYTEPDSPDLSRAYFSPDDEELSRTVIDYCRFAEAEESYFESDSDSDCESEYSENTTSTSPATTARFSGSSELSFKCKGIKPSSWYRTSKRISSYKDTLHETQDVPTYHTPLETQLQDWYEADESDESRCSSPDTFVEYHEAVFTPLTPAKPQIVGLRNAEKPSYIPQRTSSLSTKAAALEARAHRRLTSYNMSLPTLDRIPPVPQLDHTKSRPTLAKSATMPNIMHGHNAPRSTSATSFSIPTVEISPEVLTLPLVEAICDSIAGSRRDLQLNTYCISEIRRLNQLTTTTSRAQQKSKRITGSASTNNLRSIPRAKSIFALPKLPKRPATPPPAYMQRRTLKVQASFHNEPNVDALKSIFPDSNEQSLKVLYAHLLAYNYINDLSCQKLNSTTKANQKASKPYSPTLPDFGFNGYGSFMQDFSEAQDVTGKPKDGGFEAIMKGLAIRTQDILGSIKGYDGVPNMKDGSDEVDWAVVRTLAEVVKGCEGRA